MGFTIYAIKSSVDNRIYVGFTTRMKGRLGEHNSGLVRSTRFYRPWTLFYTESTESRIQARQKEKYLKSGFGKEFLKIIRDKNIRG